MLPRHSLLLLSYQRLRPWLQVLSLDFLYCTVQPAEPGFEVGVQYRPAEWNVVTALPPVGRLAAGVGVGLVPEFCTLTLTTSLRVLPELSETVAVSVCVPFANLVVSMTHCVPSA